MSPEVWMEHAVEGGADILYMQGVWRLANLSSVVAQILELRLRTDAHCILDGSRLRELDTAAGFMLFRQLDALGHTAATVSVRAMQEHHARLLTLAHGRMDAPAAAAPAGRFGLVRRLGAATMRTWRHQVMHNSFNGMVALEVLALFRRPRLFRLKETISQFETVTIDAIPIVTLVTFLIGVVFAYLLGVQAQRYGANIFVVDGVGLAISRELSPILVAVIVAGRSGAAFTAQIGSMKVQEETDAITTVGLSPIQVLVIPRLVAIIVGLPLLVFAGDLAGIAGGMLVGSLQLDISSATFVNRLHAVLDLSAVVIGLAKAPLFGAFIALIACRMGMSVTRDSRSIGEHTTSTVVQGIVWVIVLDAIFAVALQHLGF